MSAHCSACGSDITYPGDTWPVGTCERCDLADAIQKAWDAIIDARRFVQGDRGSGRKRIVLTRLDEALAALAKEHSGEN